MVAQGGECPFCQLISNPDQLITVGETENFFAWLEVNPRARGHTMVVPKEHKGNVLEFSPEEWDEAFELTREVIEKAKKGLEADGASVAVNIEEAGGQMLPHAYIQVFPRFQGEENAGTPTGAIFPQREDLQQKLDDIQEDMKSVKSDFRSGESHEPHPESQNFKSEDEIEGLLTGGMDSDSGEEKSGGEEEGEKEDREASAEETGSQSLSEVESQKLFEELLSRNRSASDLLKSPEFQEILDRTDFSLERKRDYGGETDQDWI